MKCSINDPKKYFLFCLTTVNCCHLSSYKLGTGASVEHHFGVNEANRFGIVQIPAELHVTHTESIVGVHVSV